MSSQPHGLFFFFLLFFFSIRHFPVFFSLRAHSILSLNFADEQTARSTSYTEIPNNRHFTRRLFRDKSMFISDKSTKTTLQKSHLSIFLMKSESMFSFQTCSSSLEILWNSSYQPAIKINHEIISEKRIVRISLKNVSCEKVNWTFFSSFSTMILESSHV